MSNKTINERVYSFGTLSATQAVRVECSIAAVIGEPLFKAFVDAGGDFSDDETEENKAKQKKAFEEAGMAAMGLIATRMDPDELLKTMTAVFATVTADGKRFDMDSQFTGRNKELWEVFIAALRHNFSDFLPDGLFGSKSGKK